MELSVIEKITLTPKGRGEIFQEYQGTISRSTFTAWMKELEEKNLIRKGKKILSVKEVLSVYRELGKPGVYNASEIDSF